MDERAHGLQWHTMRYQDEINDLTFKVLVLLAERPRTETNLLQKLGDGPPPYYLENVLYTLREDGVIDYNGYVYTLSNGGSYTVGNNYTTSES